MVHTMNIRDTWDKVDVAAKAVGAVGSIAIPVALFLVGQQISERQRVAADKQLQADRVERMLAHLASQNPDEKKLAVRVLEFFVSDRQFPAELLPPLQEIASSAQKEDVAESATVVLQRVAAGGQREVASAAKAGLASLPPRVNVHPAAQDGNKAQAAITELQHNDVVVAQQAALVDPPRKTELRYFRKEDAQQAVNIVTDLARKGVTAELRDMSSALQQKTVRPKTFDLFIGKE
jgi:hypothetical protein